MKKKIISILLLSLFITFSIIYPTLSSNLATPTDLDPPNNTTITVTKIVKGEIWSVRCDVMD